MESACKKTLGRRKIEIKKIEKKQNLQVTFTKRRRGLFRKASELSVLCGAEIAILVQSPAGRIFAYGHPSPDELIDRFQMRLSFQPPAIGTHWIRSDVRIEYDEAVRRLEMEKKLVSEGQRGMFFWCDEDHDRMDLHELEEYLVLLEKMRCTAEERAVELEKLRTVDSADPGSNPDLLSLPYVDDHDFSYIVGPFDDRFFESSAYLLS